MIIRVKDCIDEIIQQCFSDDLKTLLEFNIVNNTFSTKDQFLYYYENAKYLGTKDALIRAIKFRIHKNEPLILQLTDQHTNLQRIIELGEYNKVQLRYLESLGTESSLGASASSSKTTNKQSDNYSGIEQNNNINITDEQTAIAQTNAVEKLEVQLPQPTIENDPQNKTYNKYSLGDQNVTETPTNYTDKKINKPKIEEDEPFGYQNFTKDITTNETGSNTSTNTSRGSDSRTTSDSRSATSNVKGTRGDEHERTVEFITNDARFKLWSKEVPRLKSKFWNSFYTLFCGFDYYEC